MEKDTNGIEYSKGNRAERRRIARKLGFIK